MLAGENLMNSHQKARSEATKGEQDRASESLADSSLNQAPALPGGPPARDEGRQQDPPQ